MTHLTRDELLRWRDRGAAEDRDRVIGHLAGCEACRHELAEIVRLGPIAAQPSRFDPDAFISRGLKANRPVRTAWWRLPKVWVPVSAGLLGVLLALTFVRSTPPSNSVAVRGTEVLAMAPAGDVDRVSEFRWTSPFAAARYRVIVRDASNTVALMRETSDERITIGADESRQMSAGRYSWTVEALDGSGRVIAASPPQTFDLR